MNNTLQIEDLCISNKKKKNKYPIDIAQQQKNTEVFKFLLKKMIYNENYPRSGKQRYYKEENNGDDNDECDASKSVSQTEQLQASKSRKAPVAAAKQAKSVVIPIEEENATESDSLLAQQTERSPSSKPQSQPDAVPELSDEEIEKKKEYFAFCRRLHRYCEEAIQKGNT